MLACIAALALAATPPAAPILPAHSFMDRVGVNTHLPYTDGRYADVARVLSQVRYLGVSHLRDFNLQPGEQGQAGYETAAAAGLRFDVVFRGWNVAAGLAPLKAYRQRHADAVAAVEGPNEVNNAPVEYAGLKGGAGAVALQAALYGAVKADPQLKSLAVYNVTSYPDLKGAADYANVHAYARGGDQPLRELTASVRRQRAVMPGGPMVLTETGYTTLLSDRDGVSEDVQARLILNSLFDAVLVGASRVYIYELLDAYPDPAGSDKEKHFGLFRLDGSPKPAARALHALSAILGPVAGPRGPGPRPAPTVSGLPADTHSLRLTASDGGGFLALWREPRVWDPGRKAALSPAPVRLTVAARTPLRVYDPLRGAEPVFALQGGAGPVDLGDHVLLIRF